MAYFLEMYNEGEGVGVWCCQYGGLKGLCYARRMRMLMRNTLKLLAQFFQTLLESSGQKLFSSV